MFLDVKWVCFRTVHFILLYFTFLHEIIHHEDEFLSGFEDKTPHHLSGGQQKRVAIAGIVAMRPDIMILDEPTAGLDPEGVDKVLAILNKLNSEGMSIVISSHDIEMVNEFADRIFVLYNGEIIAEGNNHQIFSDKELMNYYILIQIH